MVPPPQLDSIKHFLLAKAEISNTQNILSLSPFCYMGWVIQNGVNSP
jgi:hypothetical protein